MNALKRPLRRLLVEKGTSHDPKEGIATVHAPRDAVAKHRAQIQVSHLGFERRASVTAVRSRRSLMLGSVAPLPKSTLRVLSSTIFFV